MNQIYNQCCELPLIFQLPKQVSSRELPSSRKYPSRFSNKYSPIGGRLLTKYQVQAANKAKQTITRTNCVVYNPRQTCDTFVASKHKRKSISSSSFKSFMSSSLSSTQNSLSFAQSLALVASCFIVATLSLNFANLILAPNNFISANDISTGRRLMINKNHNHKHYQQHYHHETSPANLQPRNFNNHRYDDDPNFSRDSRHKREQKNEIDAHLYNYHHKQKQQNHNYHTNKQKPLSQQVPEQLPIVVSISDNSYVSASPVESTTIKSTTTTTSTTSNSNTANEHISLHKIKKHRTRYLLHHPSSSNSFSRRNNNDDASVKHHHHQPQQRRLNQLRYHRQKPSNHLYLLNSRQTYSNDDDLRNDVGQSVGEESPEEDEEEASKEAQQLTSSSDISTTATTTQRNRDKYHKNVAQIDHSSDLEEQGQDETNIHKGLEAHYRIKSAAIIKTRESIDMGATFLNYTIVTNLNACLVECWITDSCDTAIYQESPVDFNSNNNDNNNIDHLPNSFAGSKEHYSLTSLMEPSHVPRTTPLSNSIDESKTIFDSNNIYISGNNNYIERDADNKKNDDSQKDSIRDDNEFSRPDLNIRNHVNYVDNDDGVDDEQDHSDGEYNTNSDNRRSKITSHFVTKLPENGFFICYLFECVKPDGFKCQFSAHNYYVSATKRQHHMDIIAAFTTDPEIGSIEPTMTINNIDLNEPFVRNNISDKTISSSDNIMLSDKFDAATTTIAQDYYCGQNKFKCLSQDQCLPNSYKCDGIIHCSDRSDELDCSPKESSANSNGDHTTLDGYSIVVGDGSLKSDQILGKTNSQMSRSKDSLYDKVVSRYPEFSVHSKANINEVQKITESGSGLQPEKQNYILIDEGGENKVKAEFNLDLSRSTLNDIEPRYSNIITSHSNYHPINGRQQWHDSHIASIKMSQEEYDYGYQKRGNGMNSAIIAIMFGIGVTGMLVMIVGHKMKSIGKRIAYKGRRRSLVPDMDFLINTMPI